MTRIRIDAKVRKKVSASLNTALAYGIDLHLAAKQAHWNIKGPNFIALHELLDAVADRLEEQVDTMAERITALGHIAEGTTQAVAKASKLKAYPADEQDWKKLLGALCDGLAEYGELVRASIDAAAAAGDADTADVFTEVSRAIDKDLWFLDSHLA